jgi:hypothetical protein
VWIVRPGRDEDHVAGANRQHLAGHTQRALAVSGTGKASSARLCARAAAL